MDDRRRSCQAQAKVPITVSQPDPFRRLLTASALAPLLVAFVTVVAFLPVLKNGFLDWDDEETLVNNLHYRGLGWANLRWMFTTTHMGHWVPLSWMTFGADYLVWGMNPFGYHLTNLLLHASGAVVFYFIALRLLGKAQPVQGSAVLRAGAGAAALFFAIHPLRVESVAWVTERRDVLSGLWFFLTILLYLKAAASTVTRRRWWLTGSVGCYTLAVASKGIVMTLPLLLVILDVYPLRRLGSSWRQWKSPEARGIWAEKTPYILLAAAAAGMAIYAGHSIADPLGARPLAGRIGVAFYGLVFYIQKTAVPFGIWPLYQIPPRVDPFATPIVGAALAVAAFSGGLFLLRRKWPAGLAVWLSYAILLSPVSGIMQTGPQLVAARYSYLPCLGLALLVGAGVCFLLRMRERRRLGPARVRAGAAALILSFAGLGALTWQQARTWHDPLTLWSYAVSVAPGFSVAQSNLGVALIRAGRLTEARGHLEEAVRLSPDYVEALTALASVLGDLGTFNEAEDVLRRLGFALMRHGKLDQAVPLLQGVVQIRPTDAVAHNSLGIALFLRGDRTAAVEQFRQAVQSDPGFEEARENLARALAQQHR